MFIIDPQTMLELCFNSTSAISNELASYLSGQYNFNDAVEISPGPSFTICYVINVCCLLRHNCLSNLFIKLWLNVCWVKSTNVKYCKWYYNTNHNFSYRKLKNICILLTYIRKWMFYYHFVMKKLLILIKICRTLIAAKM